MVRIRIKDNNRIPAVLKNIDKMNRIKAKIGYMSGGENQMIAAVHEFGVTIPVTDKMRGYLGAHGLHLKKTTTQIIIPERSFIRTGADMHEADVQRKASELIDDAIAMHLPIETFFQMLGLELKGKIQEFAADLNNPVNHPFTVEMKGSSNPLVDTGGLIGSMEVEVE